MELYKMWKKIMNMQNTLEHTANEYSWKWFLLVLRTSGLLRTLITFDTGYINCFFFFRLQPRFAMYCEHRARSGTENVIRLHFSFSTQYKSHLAQCTRFWLSAYAQRSSSTINIAWSLNGVFPGFLGQWIFGDVHQKLPRTTRPETHRPREIMRPGD